MSNVILSPNMNLPIPIPGVDPGPDYALNLNASLMFIDQHNHSAGSGVLITPSGLNINSSLPFNNQEATSLKAAVFTPQTSLSVLNSLYFSGVDLYVGDGSGNQIQITAAGVVNATASGISSGTANASFVAGVLVVDSASLTPANIQAGSILLGNNVASSKFLTLAPPSSMAANYSLTLPSLPSVTSIMALDNSGNMSAPYTVDGSTIVISSNIIKVAAGGITSTQIANNTIGNAQLAGNSINTSNIIDNAVTRVKQSYLGTGQATVSSIFTTSSSFISSGCNVVVGTTVLGSTRPVFINFTADATLLGSLTTATAAEFRINRNSGTFVNLYKFSLDYLAGSNSATIPLNLTYIDTSVGVGTQNYLLEFRILLGGNRITLTNIIGTAYQL